MDVDIFIITNNIYIHTPIYIYIFLSTHHQSMWMLANGHICWSIPSHFPNLVAEAPISLLTEFKNCPISHEGLTLRFGVPKTGEPGAVTAGDTWTHQAVQLIVTTWRLDRIGGNGFVAVLCFISCDEISVVWMQEAMCMIGNLDLSQ